MDIEEVSAIRMIAVGSVIAEYGAIKLKDRSKQDLKQRVATVIAASNKVQDWFKFNPNVSSHYEKQFTDEFTGDKMVLLAKVLELCSPLSVKSLEYLINELEAV